MTVLDELTERNRTFAYHHPGHRAALQPTLKALILTCADHRVDPAHILGLELNDAVVVRNPGGRATPDFLVHLAVLATVAQAEGLNSGFELILMQHTDCGLSHLSGEEHAPVLAPLLGVRPEEVAGKSLTDPWAAVRSDVAELRENPLIPETLVISGIVYNVDDGTIDVVVPPATE